jgi:hypothetical protein
MHHKSGCVNFGEEKEGILCFIFYLLPLLPPSFLVVTVTFDPNLFIFWLKRHFFVMVL